MLACIIYFLCSMRCIRLIIILILSAATMCSAQDFFVTQERIFTSATDQWLALELTKVNPKHFDCSTRSTNWQIPSGEMLPFLDQKIPLSKAEKEKFTALLFPGGDCKRYLQLISLCDLYFPLFRKKAEVSGLDPSFKILPLLLSGCDQNFSENGKAGLWAMDYLVARKFHLRVDSLVDERRGGDFTTDIAFQYLKELSEKFNGDPAKIITAYRKGVPHVLNLEQQMNGKAFMEILDPDSRMFIGFFAFTSQLLASTRVENQLTNYFDIMAQYESVIFEKNVQVKALVNVLGLDEANLHLTNPVFTGDIVQGGYRKVPYQINDVAALRLDALKDSIYRWKPPVPIISVPDKMDETVYYRVKRGDSLGKIARKYRVSAKQLRLWNKMKNDRIREGQQLIVHSGRKNELAAAKAPTPIPMTDEKAIDTTPVNKKEDQDNAAEASTPAKKKQDKKEEVYIVKSGDSLWKIARKYKGVTEEDIMKWNKCGSDIRPGQKLIIRIK